MNDKDTINSLKNAIDSERDHVVNRILNNNPELDVSSAIIFAFKKNATYFVRKLLYGKNPISKNLSELAAFAIKDNSKIAEDLVNHVLINENNNNKKVKYLIVFNKLLRNEEYYMSFSRFFDSLNSISKQHWFIEKYVWEKDRRVNNIYVYEQILSYAYESKNYHLMIEMCRDNFKEFTKYFNKLGMDPSRNNNKFLKEVLQKGLPYKDINMKYFVDLFDHEKVFAEASKRKDKELIRVMFVFLSRDTKSKRYKSILAKMLKNDFIKKDCLDELTNYPKLTYYAVKHFRLDNSLVLKKLCEKDSKFDKSEELIVTKTISRILKRKDINFSLIEAPSPQFLSLLKKDKRLKLNNDIIKNIAVKYFLEFNKEVCKLLENHNIPFSFDNNKLPKAYIDELFNRVEHLINNPRVVFIDEVVNLAEIYHNIFLKQDKVIQQAVNPLDKDLIVCIFNSYLALQYYNLKIKKQYDLTDLILYYNKFKEFEKILSLINLEFNERINTVLATSGGRGVIFDELCSILQGEADEAYDKLYETIIPKILNQSGMFDINSLKEFSDINSDLFNKINQNLKSECSKGNTIKNNKINSYIKNISNNMQLLSCASDTISNREEYHSLSGKEESAMDKNIGRNSYDRLQRVINDNKKSFLLFSKNKNASEALVNVENKIREEILARILQASEYELKLLKKDNIDKIKQHKLIINFIKNNKKKILAGDKSSLVKARNLFDSNVIASHIAWRIYDKDAKCVNWPNLLTPVSSKIDANVTVLSTAETSPESSKTLKSAVQQCREYAAYVFVSFLNEENYKDLVDDFIFYLSEIRRTHNETTLGDDDPSCFPGTVTRIANSLSKHSKYKEVIKRHEVIKDASRSYIEIEMRKYFNKISSDKNLNYKEVWNKQQSFFAAAIQNDYDSIYNRIPYYEEVDTADFDENWLKIRQKLKKMFPEKRAIERVNSILKKKSRKSLTPEELVIVRDALANIGNSRNLPTIKYSFDKNCYKPYKQKLDLESKEKEIDKHKVIDNPFDGYDGTYEDYQNRAINKKLPITFVKRRFKELQASGYLYDSMQNQLPKLYKSKKGASTLIEELVMEVIREVDKLESVSSIDKKSFNTYFNNAAQNISSEYPSLFSKIIDDKVLKSNLHKSCLSLDLKKFDLKHDKSNKDKVMKFSKK